MACSHGVDGSPCGVAVRWASWRSLSAWLKNFDWAAFGADDGALDDAGALLLLAAGGHRPARWHGADLRS